MSNSYTSVKPRLAGSTVRLKKTRLFTEAWKHALRPSLREAKFCAPAVSGWLVQPRGKRTTAKQVESSKDMKTYENYKNDKIT